MPSKPHTKRRYFTPKQLRPNCLLAFLEQFKRVEMLREEEEFLDSNDDYLPRFFLLNNKSLKLMFKGKYFMVLQNDNYNLLMSINSECSYSRIVLKKGIFPILELANVENVYFHYEPMNINKEEFQKWIQLCLSLKGKFKDLMCVSRFFI